MSCLLITQLIALVDGQTAAREFVLVSAMMDLDLQLKKNGENSLTLKAA